jgi:hypothetical protein
MDTPSSPAELPARPLIEPRSLIEHCRREIAAGWGYLEAARDILGRSRELQARWAEQLRLAVADEEANLAMPDRSEAARIGMFVGVGLNSRWHKRRHRAPRMAHPTRKPPLVQARRRSGRG